ncbi:MAG: GNAT family N-acetyltransferase [Limnothrix sp.]
MKLLFRFAEPKDLPNILQLQALSLRVLLAPTVADEVLDNLITQQHIEREKRDELILVALCNHDFIGFIALRTAQSQISGLFVHPDFVRQGIGTELITAAAEIMRVKKQRKLLVMASEYAKPFYKKMGFKTLRRSYLFVKRRQKIRVFWMRKELQELTPEEQQQRLSVGVVLAIVIVVSLWAAIA